MQIEFKYCIFVYVAMDNNGLITRGVDAESQIFSATWR